MSAPAQVDQPTDPPSKVVHVYDAAAVEIRIVVPVRRRLVARRVRVGVPLRIERLNDLTQVDARRVRPGR